MLGLEEAATCRRKSELVVVEICRHRLEPVVVVTCSSKPETVVVEICNSMEDGKEPVCGIHHKVSSVHKQRT